MAFIDEVFIVPSAFADVQKWSLGKQLQKSAFLLQNGYYDAVQLRKREPKQKNIWYFRLNQQFRAWCHIEHGKCEIFSIDNHQ